LDDSAGTVVVVVVVDIVVNVVVVVVDNVVVVVVVVVVNVVVVVEVNVVAVVVVVVVILQTRSVERVGAATSTSVPKSHGGATALPQLVLFVGSGWNWRPSSHHLHPGFSGEDARCTADPAGQTTTTGAAGGGGGGGGGGVLAMASQISQDIPSPEFGPLVHVQSGSIDLVQTFWQGKSVFQSWT
jgi:hypothetical protein